MNYNEEIGKETIDKQKHERRVFAEAYGMEGKTFYFYLKGTPVPKLSQECRDWIHAYNIETNDGLPYNCLYNVDKQYGFSS